MAVPSRWRGSTQPAGVAVRGLGELSVRSISMLSVVCAAAFVVGLAEPSAAAPPLENEPPLVESSAALAASVAAIESGEAAEAVSLTTPTERILALPDGTFRYEVSTVPLRAEVAEGQWETINTDLVLRDGWWEPSVSATPVRFTDGLSVLTWQTSSDIDRTLAVLGSFSLKGEIDSMTSNSAVVTFTAVNVMSLGSGISFTDELRELGNNFSGETGPASDVRQEFTWQETIRW